MTFWLTPDQKRLLASPQMSGVIETALPLTNLVKRNVDTTKIDIQAGKGQLVDNSVFGSPKIKKIEWVAQTITAGIGLSGNYGVAIDTNGIAQVLYNNNTSTLSPSQYVNYIQLGAVQLTVGVVSSSISIGLVNTNALGNSLYTQETSLGVYNFTGVNGYILSAGTTNLQINISAGSAFSPLGGSLLNLQTPALVERPARTPTTLIVLANPITGGFSLSGTATINPTLNAHRGTITSASTVGGGTSTKFDSLAHGMQIGDTVSLTTTLYNGNFVITAKTTNDFTVLTPFLGTTTGTWNGLTATLLNQFTVQRCFIFPQSGIAAFYYGLKEYASINLALTDYISEDFTEFGLTATACNAGILVVRNNASWADTTSYYFKAITQRIK